MNPIRCEIAGVPGLDRLDATYAAPNRRARRRAAAHQARSLTVLRTAEGVPVVCRVREARAVTAVVLAERRQARKNATKQEGAQ